jgi:excisionase family DNA binding protein
MERLLSLEQVAEYLQVDLAVVRSIVDAGQLPSVRIGSAVRVKPEDLEHFVDAQMRAQQLDAASRKLSDPRAWAKIMDEDPEFKSKVMETQYAPGTMGAWLKKASADADAKRESDNVVDLPVRK